MCIECAEIRIRIACRHSTIMKPDHSYLVPVKIWRFISVTFVKGGESLQINEAVFPSFHTWTRLGMTEAVLGLMKPPPT